jgi:hypothetical protein
MFAYTIVAGALLASLGADAPRGVGMDEAPPRFEGTWAAWHGCWRSTAEGAPAGEILCLLPGSSPSEVRMVSIADGAVTGTTRVLADAVARRVEEGGCTGTETAHWSRDARRVFMRAELECEGMHRVSTGVLAMVADDEWVDVQAATVSGQHATRSIRYRAVPASLAPAEIQAQLDDRRELAREAARLRATAPLHVEDVIEAAGMLAEPALQGFLATQALAFRPDAQSLLRLEAAGVPASGIDVVVAVGYPQRFAVREAGAIHTVARGPGDVRRCYDPVPGIWMYGDDCYYTSQRWGYSRYGYGWGYSPWGYDPYGWRYGPRPVIIVRPGDGEDRVPSEAVKGSGYTRGGAPSRGTAQPRSNSGGSGNSGSSDAVRSSGESGRSAPPPAREAVPRSSGSSSGSGSTSGSSGSSSSGSSGSDTGSSGRTAVPRGGG